MLDHILRDHYPIQDEVEIKGRDHQKMYTIGEPVMQNVRQKQELKTRIKKNCNMRSDKKSITDT